jgi:hypothetical protein
VFSLAHMLDLLSNELARRGARALALAQITPGSL